MLIVVAIIAILVAVSIPIVGNSLERAREATDAANERAAKAEVLIAITTRPMVLQWKRLKLTTSIPMADAPSIRTASCRSRSRMPPARLN